MSAAWPPSEISAADVERIRELAHVPGGRTHWFRFAEGGGEFFSVTSAGNASAMFTAFANGINWTAPDREEMIGLALSYGQTVVVD